MASRSQLMRFIQQSLRGPTSQWREGAANCCTTSEHITGEFGRWQAAQMVSTAVSAWDLPAGESKGMCIHSAARTAQHFGSAAIALAGIGRAG
ncbi:hypothetical protein PI125_g886 [Phytophthora idaei]|nr:hypothetical protein PI125_g886 [Phytophthora idaei]